MIENYDLFKVIRTVYVGTFYAVKSTKMDENQFRFFLNRKLSRDSGSYQVFAVTLTRRKCQTHSVFFFG